MPTLSDVSGEADPTAAIQDFIDNNEIVEFAAGTVFTFSRSVEVPSNRILFSDATNPAILRRTGSTARTLVANGEHIRIYNLKFDWNFGGTWQNFRSHIALAPPSGAAFSAATSLGDIVISGCEFYESSGNMGSHGGGDSWCVSLSPGNVDQDITGLKILGCKSTEIVQLTGNGTLNGTWSDVEIAYNYIANGRAGSIAMSSLATSSNSRETVFDSVHVHHNVIRNAYTTGVFIGQDNGEATGGQVNITDLLIENNLIDLGIVSQFPIATLIRSGNASGYTAGATVRNNIINLLRSKGAGNSPRIMTMTGSSPTNSTLSFSGNVFNGRGDFTTTLTTVTQSGNTYLNGDSWSP